MLSINWKKTRMALVLTGFLVAGSVVTQARAEHEAGEATEALVIPATAGEIWAKVKEKHQELHQIMADNKLAEVHKVAFAIRDYVGALPKKSPSLSKAKMVSLKTEVKLIARLASMLDEAGDSGDAAKVKSLSLRLDKELKKIEALYPANALMAAGMSEASKDKAAVVYTCSMHPEVTSDKPGVCPKCGMDLVVKK